MEIKVHFTKGFQHAIDADFENVGEELVRHTLDAASNHGMRIYESVYRVVLVVDDLPKPLEISVMLSQIEGEAIVSLNGELQMNEWCNPVTVQDWKQPDLWDQILGKETLTG